MQQSQPPCLIALHHIGIGVTAFAPAIAVYERLGHRLLQCVADEGLGVWVAFLAPPEPSAPLVEILAPLGKTSPLSALIARRVLPAPYHTGYSVRDLGAASAWLRSEEFMPVTEPAPAMALGGASIAFFYHQVIGLLELIENPLEFSAPGDEDRLRLAAVVQASI